MLKKIALGTFLLTAVLGIILFSFCILPCFAEVETLPLTTYYPSPVGIYNQLVTHTLGVGDNNGDSILNHADVPDPATNSGDVWIAGKVGIGTTNPQAKLSIGGDGFQLYEVYSTIGGNSVTYTALYGEGTSSATGVIGKAALGTGVWGISDSYYGVKGKSHGSGLDGVGVYGEGGDYGVYGYVTNDTAVGVRGTSFEHIGILGENINGGAAGVAGVVGTSPQTGVFGTGTTGVKGSGWGNVGYGIQGDGQIGVAGRGIQNDPMQDCYGVIGTSPQTGVYGAGPIGVYGSSTDSSSFGKGVYGEASGSAYAGYFTGNVYITGDLTVFGTAYLPNVDFNLPSDKRYKKDIKTLNNPLEKLLNLRGIDFKWRRDEFKKKHFPEGKQIGIIAQELEKEYPELVSTDKEGYKSIKYAKLTAVLLEAVKALREEYTTEIESLKKEIEKLKNGYSR